MMRRRISVSLIAGTLLVLAALGGCGVPADGDPQAIPRADLPPELIDPSLGSSTTLPQSAGTTTVPVYLLEEIADGVRLVAVEREVTQANLPNERLATLFSVGATEAEIADGITSAIPGNTVLLDVTTDPDSREVTIDLSTELPIEGEALAQAFAQMVWTATAPEAGGYTQVRFLVEGEPTTVLDGDGAVLERAVLRRDYSEFAPLESP
jgi:spore germination protein GerM